jgi:16S rRNA (adenine1518-N6/adenine1519-N6)-dimethyltransferase
MREAGPVTRSPVRALGPADVRRLAAELGIRPTKALGQNFVHDANTVRRIARLSGATEADVVVEVGPGLGSLTLALLETGAHVVAVEVDPVLAAALPRTLAEHAGPLAGSCDVVHANALTVPALPRAPTAMVSNLPYNVAVPVLLTMIEAFPTIARVLVLVQAEVADRLAAAPGTPAYGVPSVKAAWYGSLRRVGTVPRSVFWPVPNVESGLVGMQRRPPPRHAPAREEVFACVDAAFSQRRKTLRAALAAWAGSREGAELACREAGVDPGARGEQLGLADFVAIAATRCRSPRAGRPAPQ